MSNSSPAVRIATLGPAETFSERATQAYASSLQTPCDIRLYPTFRKVFAAVKNECDEGVLPIENLVEGCVQPVLDLLLHSDLVITSEILLPITFSFVANAAKISRVRTLYAQFATQGQCAAFIDTLENVTIITTDSNGTSLSEILKGADSCGAIIPRHSLDSRTFATVVENVNDVAHNLTRFVSVSRTETPCIEGREYKTSLVVMEGMDRPGMLADILSAFSRRGVNLVSIMSRPTKESLGNYHFYIDIEGHCAQEHIKGALTEIQKHNFVRLLGSYPRAVAPT